ncbi:MAG TPA: hypothetical protein PLU11_13770 [Chitinophagaceae bacterium]|nr:hypothetical protein [Chitinophagaceae bacterium]HPN60248.1 hypothetical protein [Chitinophagaceae bacterium]
MLLLVLTAGITGSSYACTCIGKDKQTTESEFSSSKLVVKGKIIASTDYLYYDTLITLFTGIPFDRATSGYMIRQYKIYTLVVESRFKSDKGLADTLRIVTGYGNGDCGYEFETGKDYIVYANAWTEKKLIIKQRKKKIKKKIREEPVTNWFYTDICRLTQESNQLELDKIKNL